MREQEVEEGIKEPAVSKETLRRVSGRRPRTSDSFQILLSCRAPKQICSFQIGMNDISSRSGE